MTSESKHLFGPNGKPIPRSASRRARIAAAAKRLKTIAISLGAVLTILGTMALNADRIVSFFGKAATPSETAVISPDPSSRSHSRSIQPKEAAIPERAASPSASLDGSRPGYATPVAKVSIDPSASASVETSDTSQNNKLEPNSTPSVAHSIQAVDDSGSLEATATYTSPPAASPPPTRRKHSYICEGTVIFPNGRTDRLISCSNIQVSFTPFTENVNRDYISVDFDRIRKLTIRRLSDEEKVEIEKVFRYGSNVIRSFDIMYWDGTMDTGFGPAGHFLETVRYGSNNLLAAEVVLFKKNGVFKRDYSR